MTETTPKPKQSKARPKQGKAVSKRFVKPALAEVEEYVSAKGYTFSPEAFWSYYEAVGWKGRQQADEELEGRVLDVAAARAEEGGQT